MQNNEDSFDFRNSRIRLDGIRRCSGPTVAAGTFRLAVVSPSLNDEFQSTTGVSPGAFPISTTISSIEARENDRSDRGWREISTTLRVQRPAGDGGNSDTTAPSRLGRPLPGRPPGQPRARLSRAGLFRFRSRAAPWGAGAVLRRRAVGADDDSASEA